VGVIRWWKNGESKHTCKEEREKRVVVYLHNYPCFKVEISKCVQKRINLKGKMVKLNNLKLILYIYSSSSSSSSD